MTQRSGSLPQRSLFAVIFILWSIFPVYSQVQGPTITKIEPPNWWAALPSPTLLLYGSGLDQARATLLTAPKGVTIKGQDTGKDGRYLFVRLSGTEHALPGQVKMRVDSPSGKTEIVFELEKRNAGSAPKSLTADDVIYLIMPDRFADGDPANNHPAKSPNTYDRSQARAYHGGDLKGIRDHLEYLQDLGANLLWLTPILDNDDDSPQDYHGYGAVDFYAVDEHFGSLEDFQHLVDDAHKRGMRIYMDDVVNHTGPRHAWAAHPPSDCWLHGTQAKHPPFSDDFLSITDPHATKSQWYNTVAGWFAGVLPDIDNDCPEVEQYLFQHAVWWREKTGIDGFRLDTFPYSSRQFWAKWHSDLRKLYPDIADIGEVFNGDPAITAFFQGGRKQFDGSDSGVTTVFDFPAMFAIRDILAGKAPARRLAAVLGRDSLYPHPEKLVTFFANHDLPRLASAPNSSPEKIKMAFGLVATLRGIPQLYAGDEIGMEGGDDPDNRRDFPGGFPGDQQNAFTVQGRTAHQNEIFEFARSVFKLRREHAALREGRQFHAVVSDDVYSFTRTDGHEMLLVTLNASARPQQVPLSNDEMGALPHASRLRPLLSSAPDATASAEFIAGKAMLDVSPFSITVHLVEKQNDH